VACHAEGRGFEPRRSRIERNKIARLPARWSRFPTYPHAVHGAPPGSALPDELRQLGYGVRHVGSTMQIDPVSTVETIAAERSSMSPLRHVAHAAIVQVNVYELNLPPGARPA
jgi:hypothetical protein